jgi:hypothetical protein
VSLISEEKKPIFFSRKELHLTHFVIHSFPGMTLTFGAGPFRAALAYFLFALKVVVVAYSGQHLQHLHKAMHVCICRSFSMVLTTDAAWNLWPGISGIGSLKN